VFAKREEAGSFLHVRLGEVPMRFLLSPGRLLALALPIAAVCGAGSPLRAGFVNRVYRDADGAHRYAVFVPEGYSVRRAWPVVLFLHGAGERGTDGLRPTTVGLGPVIRRDPKAFPFLAVFPQCENLRGRLLASWNADTADGRRALRILKDVEARYRVDPKRRVLTGWSMGGYGAWSLAAARPGFWSAVVPVSGGGDAALAKKLRGVPIWAFHGEQDRFVLPSESRAMVEAVRSAGGTAQFTLVKGIGHDVWKAVYSDPPLLNWMRNPSGKGDRPAKIVATDAQKSIARNDELVPFAPAVEISHAVTVRVANNILKGLSYSVPQMVGKDMLSGKIADIKETTFADGHTFNLSFIGIAYAGELADARIQALRGNRLRIQLALRNVSLRISKSYVIGRRRWAATGPMQIAIGRRRPVWLSMELQPRVVKRRLRFRTLSKSFQIPNDDWRVSPPASVEVHGLGMTKANVSSGLVSGVRERKRRIEQEVLALVPSVVREIEKKLAVPDSMGPIAELWPLPVYSPRLRIWPETAVADEQGMTVTFGLTAAAIDPSQAPKTPRRVTGSETQRPASGKRKGLRVEIAAELLPALTQLLIDADVARLHVSDIPSSPFLEFVDPAVMTAVLPDLKRFGTKLQLSAELMFRKPLRVAWRSHKSGMRKAEVGKRRSEVGTRRSEAGGHHHSPLTTHHSQLSTLNAGPVFEIPEGVLAVSIRNSPDADWKPYAEFTIRLSHPLTFGIRKTGFTQRAADIQWRDEPTIAVRGRFVNGSEPADLKIDAGRVRDVFAKGWKTWSESFSRSKPRVPDLVVGKLPLRMENLDWNTNGLVAAFAAPGVKLTNETTAALTYEVKGPRSTWGGPYTLEPGRSHEFDVPYSLVFRRRVGNQRELFTLPAGSHSAYRTPRSGGGPASLYQSD
jgi:poly(3-hydroxybutyrate) depolymerase